LTVSKSLKKLVAQGYIRREESQQDTRANWVYLTFKGVPFVEEIDAEFFGKTPKSDQQTLIHILGKLMAETND
jgi:DNA-binding MarR family transcriptional regulator